MNSRLLLPLGAATLISLHSTAQCPGGITTAIALKQALTTTTSGTLYVCGTVDLGDLPETDFPLIVKPGVTLRGDFDLHTSPFGTLIRFPYQYLDGIACKDPANLGFPTAGTQVTGAAFALQQGARIEHIRLEGPSTEVKDWRYAGLFDCSNVRTGEHYEGLSTGVIVKYGGCAITDSEIFGFGYAAVSLHVALTAADFHFERNFIHHNRWYGYGYGIWISGPSSSTPGPNQGMCLPSSVTCSSSTSAFRGLFGTGLDAYFSNNIFVDNKHDIAGSANNCSYHIDECSFLGRGDWNIDRHGYNSSCDAKTPTFVQSDAGGRITRIEDSFFYRPSQTIGITYPNTNNCGTGGAVVDINRNMFIDPSGAQGTTKGHIQIGGVVNWLTAWSDPAYANIIKLTTPGNYWHLAEPTTPTGFNTGMTVKPPIARVSSSVAGAPYVTGTVQEITVGTTVDFTTDACFDANGASPPVQGMAYVWRFHDTEDEIADEQRTSAHPASSPLQHTFNDIGIAHVDLMAVDPDHHASNFARQQFIIKPPPGDEHVYLSFWTKDSFVGHVLSECDRSSFSDERYADEAGPVGFMIYVNINDNYIYLDDIAGNEGWQRHELIIDDYITSDDTNLPGLPDYLEIGLMCTDGTPIGTPTTFQGADADQVRGVVFTIDDVYINANNGWNALKNGAFEKSGPEFAWTRFNEENYGVVPMPLNCTTFPPSVWTSLKAANAVGITNINGAVHGGEYSLVGYVRPVSDWTVHLPNDPNNKKAVRYEPGSLYEPGIYKSVRQSFNVAAPPPKSLVTYQEETAPVLVEVLPNPVEGGDAFYVIVTTEAQFAGSMDLEIIDLSGHLVNRRSLRPGVNTVGEDLAAGIYMLRATIGEQVEVRRICIQ